MNKILLAVLAPLSLMLAACVTVDVPESRFVAIERTISIASDLAEAAWSAGKLSERNIIKIRQAVTAARMALGLARDAAAAGRQKEADRLANEALSKLSEGDPSPAG